MRPTRGTKASIRAWLAEGEGWPGRGGLLQLSHVENSGAAFGILQGAAPFLLVTTLVGVVAVAAFVFFAPPERRFYTVALAFVLGGAAGNLIDRATRGTVTDFIDPTHYPGLQPRRFRDRSGRARAGVALAPRGPRPARRRREMSAPRRSFTANRRDRLDRLVAEELVELSRSQARRLIEDGRVAVNAAVATKAGLFVGESATVTVELPVVPDLDLLAGDVPLHIVFEDEETLVIDKEPGLVVHPAPGAARRDAHQRRARALPGGARDRRRRPPRRGPPARPRQPRE